VIDIKDIVLGESYACRFRLGEYEGLGLLLVRDLDQGIVKLKDTQTMLELVIPFSDIWDIDTIEWTGNDPTEEP
jgi:hypothetical protein